MKLGEYIFGRFENEKGHEVFTPRGVNHAWEWDDKRVNVLLEQAAWSVSALNQQVTLLPDRLRDGVVGMHVAMEAVASRAVDGGSMGLFDSLLPVRQLDEVQRPEGELLKRCRDGVLKHTPVVRSRGLKLFLLKDVHYALLQKSGWAQRELGDFREKQVWVGGTRLDDAVYIPPHSEHIAGLMEDLEAFWNNEVLELPDLVKLAVCHYQFLTIHPFVTANGVMGRMLLLWLLLHFKLMDVPVLSLSRYFERHALSYVQGLSTVRATGDMVHWLRFFLFAVKESANEGLARMKRLRALVDEMERVIVGLGRRSERAAVVLDSLYRMPLITVSDVQRLLRVTPVAANNLVQALVNSGVLKEYTGYKRNRIFVFDGYFELF